MEDLNRAQKILVVDDEPDIVHLITYNLEKAGYAVRVAENGTTALAVAKSFIPDLILLDVMMPEMDGMETCQRLREMPSLHQTLIAFLTARGEDYSQIAGFEAGADDYITKPIKPRVLLSRIQGLLRRKFQAAPDAEEPVHGVVLNREKYTVSFEGVEKTFPKKEFELLALLISQPGKVFPRELILEKVWGNEVVVGDRTIDVHIRKLREKLSGDLIITVKGVGYKFREK